MGARAALPAVVALVAATLAAHADPARWRAAGWKTDFSKTTVPLAEILPGGPPRDGIPPIDRPVFRPVAAASDLTARDPVIALVLDGEARAYPLRVLIWHEIVNDTAAGRPVAVTYCPLCNAALVFERTVAGRVLDFGTTGLLRHSDLVMWDRQTESWWQQFTGEAIVGAHAGVRLKMVPSSVMAFGEFARRHPGSAVLVPERPDLRPYGRNPYVGYDDRAGPYGLFKGDLPHGLPAMARVVVARTVEGPVAVSLAHLVAQGRIAHRGVVFAWRPGQASALDTAEIAKGRDVGSVEVSDPAGSALVHDVTFAFVLHAFVPDAAVLTEKGVVRLATGEPVR